MRRERKRNTKRILSALLAAAMTFSWVPGSVVPLTAYAEETAAAPETSAPETSAPKTTAPETSAPETSAPKTTAPETSAPETSAPETAAPETTAPETSAPETSAPETTAPETSAPETSAPETSAPETSAPETNAPETSAPETSASETTAPETSAPDTETDGPDVETDVPGAETDTLEIGDAESESDTEESEKSAVLQIQELIDALPEHITKDNRDAVTEQLQEILELYAALGEEEQEQVDITRCLLLQQELDEANAAMLLANELAMGSNISINSSNKGKYDNQTITGTTTNTHITIDGATVSLTIRDLNLQLTHSSSERDLMHAGIQLQNGATLYLTLEGSNTIKGGNMEAGIGVPAGCTLIITDKSTGSLSVTGGYGAAGIGAAWGTETSKGTVGNITINGGSVSAYGNNGGAGIGGTSWGSTGNITINGGSVYAKGSHGKDRNFEYVGAGIGGGFVGCVASIRITGGTVRAEGDQYNNSFSSAIGGGMSSPDCGDISITGGTVETICKGGYAIGRAWYRVGAGRVPTGSVAIGEGASVNLNGGNIDPMADGWNIYTFNGEVYDTSLDTDQSAVFTINGKSYDVTVARDASQPYYGKFTIDKLFTKSSGISGAVLQIGDKSYPVGKREESGKNVSLTFGEQEYRYCTLKAIVYDTAVTGDLPVALTGGEGWSGTLKKSGTEPYCGSFTAECLILKKTDSTHAFTIEFDGKTLTQNVTVQETMAVTFGRQDYIYSTLNMTIYDTAVTGDLPAALSCSGADWSGTMTASADVPYCGSFTTDRLVLKKSDSPVTLTVTSGSHTWTAEVTPEEGEMSAVIGTRSHIYSTLNVTVYDTAVTDDMPVTLTYGGASWSGTLKKAANVPYCGSFTTDTLIVTASETAIPLTIKAAAGGAAWTQDIIPTEGKMYVTIGTGGYQYYTLNGTIHDARITEDMTAAVTVDGEKVTDIQLNKSADHTASFSIPNLIDRAGEPAEVSVTANGITWSGTTGALENGIKTLTIGRPDLQMQKVSLVFLDLAVTAGMPVESLTISRGGVPLGPDELVLTDGAGALIADVQYRGVIEAYISAGKNTVISATVPGLNGGKPMEKTVDITADTSEVEMHRSEIDTLDLAYGDIVFDGSGTLKVTYCQPWGEKKTKELSYDDVPVVIQSNPQTAVAHQLTVQNTAQTLHVKIQDINVNHHAVSAIDIKSSTELELVGTNNVTSTGRQSPAIYVPSGSELIVGGDGTLNAVSTGRGAAIGATVNAGSGHIIINSGTVNAKASHSDSAGIGLSYTDKKDISTSITINGGRVTAQGGSNAAGIGGGNAVDVLRVVTSNIVINGGIVDARSGANGAGIGSGVNYSDRADITISGGTITAHTDSTKHYSIGTPSASSYKNKIHITGGSIKTTGKNAIKINEPVLRTFTLEGAGDNVPVTGVTRADGAAAYGVNDVYTRDGGKVYFWLNTNECPEMIQANGVNYIPKSSGSTTYVLAPMVGLKDYDGKTYDGTGLADPTEDQVKWAPYEELTFEWYRNGAALSGQPTDAGSYTLRISKGDEALDFPIEIAKKPLEITAKGQSITYGESIQTGADQITCGELASGDTLTEITVAAEEIAAGVYDNGISVSGAKITCGGTDVTENYDITYTHGQLTIHAVQTDEPCPHDIVEDGICRRCGTRMAAAVETGGKTAYYADIVSAWKAAREAGDAAVTMLISQTVTETLTWDSGKLTLTMAEGAKLSRSGEDTLIRVTGGEAALNSCTLEMSCPQYSGGCLTVQGGNAAVNITDCSISITGSASTAVDVAAGTVNIYSGTFKGLEKYDLGMNVAAGNTAVHLYGGSFTGGQEGYAISCGHTLGSILADGFTYRKDGGTWASNEELGGKQLSGTVEVLVPVTVTNRTESAETVYGYTAAEAPELSVTAETSGGEAAYQWYQITEDGDTAVEGGNGAQLTIPAGLAAGEYQFYCSAEWNGFTAEGSPVTVTVTKRPLLITGAELEEKTYDGKMDAAVAGVIFDGLADGESLRPEQDYEASAVYDDANAGTDKKASVTVTLLDSAAAKNYTLADTGSISAAGTVLAKELTAENVTVTVSPDSYTYTGSAIEPGPETVTVTYQEGDSAIVIDRSGYTLTYHNNVNAGTAAVTVTGKGNYSGEAAGEFTIGKAVITDVSAAADSVKAPKAQESVQSEAKDGSGFTGEITWTPKMNDGKYDFNTAYTAVLTLTPDENHLFGELNADGWTAAAGKDGKVSLTRTFPPTRKEKIISLNTDPIGDVVLETHTDKEGVIASLPRRIRAAVETGSVMVTLSWNCENYNTAPNAANAFTWEASEAGIYENYDTSGVTLGGSITVTNPDPSAVVITGADREITYSGSAVDVSGLFEIDKHAGAAGYSVRPVTGAGALEGSMLTVTKAGVFAVTVNTKADGVYAAGTHTLALTVKKAECPPENQPQDGTVNDAYGVDSFTFTGPAGVEYAYSLDGGQTWKDAGTPQTADGEDRGTVTILVGNAALAAGMLQVQAKETDVYKAGGICRSESAFTETLTGTAQLTGTAMYGEALLAEVTGAQEGADFTYRFYQSGKDEPLQAGKSNTYVPRAEDVGKTIYVVVTAEGYAENVTSDITAPVQKAPQTLTVPETSYRKTYGEASFALGCTTNGDGKITYSVSGSKNADGAAASDTDIISVSGDGTVTVRQAGSAVVTAALADGECYAGTESRQIIVSIGKKAAPAPAEIQRVYIYAKGSGEETVDIAAFLPKDRGDSVYTLGSYDTGIVEAAAIGADGKLTYRVGKKGAAKESTDLVVTVQSNNYEDAAVTVKISLTDKRTTVQKEGFLAAVTGTGALVYGAKLGSLTLNTQEAVFVEESSGVQVPGTLSWADPETIPAAGTTKAVWVFTPDDTETYAGCSGELSIRVDKAAVADISVTTGSVRGPEALEAVQTSVTGGTGYTAQLTWDCAADSYDFGTAYTATLTLTPEENYQFAGESAGTDELAGADGWTVTRTDGAVTLKKTFEKTRLEKLAGVAAPGAVALTEHKADAASVIAKLPVSVKAAAEKSGELQLPVKWSCETYDPAPNAENIFAWTVPAEETGGRYDCSGVMLSGTVIVTNPAALPVLIAAEDKTLTYDGSEVDLETMFEIDRHAGAASCSVRAVTGAGTLEGSMLTVTKAGVFAVTVNTEANGVYAAGSAEAVLTINKGTGRGSVAVEGWTYGETPKKPVFKSDTNGSGNVDCTYAMGGEIYAEPKDAGTYTVSAVFAETDLYTACTAEAEFTIAPRPVTVTITPGGGVYGGVIAEAAAELDGVAAGDTAPAVKLTYSGKANDGTEADSARPPQKAGTYTVTAGIDSRNYRLTGKISATFYVERAQSTLAVAKVPEKTYGDEDFTLEVTGGEGRKISYASGDQAVAAVDENGRVHIAGAGEAEITVTAAQSDNYQGKELTVSVKAAKKAVQVIAGSAEVIYGDPAPKPGYTVAEEDLVGGDALSGITVTREEGADAGEYAVIPMQEEGANPNYSIEFINGRLTVLPKSIEDAEIVLGPALTANGQEQTQEIAGVTVKNSEGEDMEATFTVTGNTAVDAGGYVMSITGTGNFTGTKEQSFAVAPAAGQPVKTDTEGNPVLGAGKIVGQVVSEAGAPVMEVDISKAEVIEILTQSGSLTAKDLAAVADGEELKIIFVISGGVSAADEAQITSLAKGCTIGSLFDIRLYKQLGGGDIVWLHQTGKPVSLTVQVPEKLIGTAQNVTRTFRIIRCHDGKAEFLTAQYDGSGALSFETDRFSGYAIAYEDTEESTEENTESTEENTESTEENTESTEENTESTEENTESTEENTESTEENTESTEENTEDTEENTESTEESTEGAENTGNAGGSKNPTGSKTAGGSKNTADRASAKTGDSSRADLWLAVMAICAAVMGAARKVNRKKKKMY